MSTGAPPRDRLPEVAPRRAAIAAAAWLAEARRHPRHLVLAALVTGLLAARASAPIVVFAAVLAGALAGRRPLALLTAGAVLAGAVLAGARLDALEGGLLAHLKGRAITARAILLEPMRERGAGPATARVRLVDGPAAGEQVVVRVHASAHGGPWPGVGDEVAIAGQVMPLGRWDAFQRRRGAQMALEATRFRPTGRRRGGLAGALDSVRRRAERGLERGLAPPEAALLRGMILGEDERLSQPVRDDFQRSGLAHILAVSGQNVMLLSVLAMAAAGLVGLPLRPRLLLALGLIAVYVPLAGGGPSIQRAGVMGAAGLVAALAGRPAQRWYALGLAAAVTLAINPLVAGEPGWQLSFAAVVALLLLAPPLKEALARRLPGPVADAAAVTLAATLGTAPLMSADFGRLSLASLPANLLAAPAVAPVMWLGMLATAAAQISPALAVPFTALAAPLLRFIGWVAHAGAGAPLAVLPLHLGSPAAVATAYAIIAGAAAGAVRWSRARAAASPPLHLAPAGGRRRHGRVAVAAVAVVVAAAVALRAAAGDGVARIPRGELVVSFLDVGQGDATLLQRNGSAVLFDTGPPDGPILRRLAEARIRHLDVLVLTHAQADHEGAALAVMRAYPPRLVLDGGEGWRSSVQRALPAALAAAHAREADPEAGESLTVGGIRLRVLWPPAPPPNWRPEGDPNERAVVAIARADGFSLLLTADAESDVTGPLDLPEVDALKVAHHGSADPGLPALLARLHPRLAAIEVGRHNPYGHPAPATLAALHTVPNVVRTDRDGTIRLYVTPGKMTIQRTGSRA